MVTEVKASAGHHEIGSSSADQGDDYVSNFLDMSKEAREEDQRDKNMTLMEGLRMYPKACFWSVALSAAIIMEGYDTNLLASFYAYQGFARKFGKFYPDLNAYQVPAQDQLGLSMCYQVGCVVGVWIGGVLPDMIGYKKTIIPAFFCTIALIFMQFFAPNVKVLMGSFVLLGVNWGSYQTMCVAYAMDVLPTSLRVYLTTFVNCCWVIGQLISSGVIKGISTSSDPNAWKIPIAIQWVFCPILIAVVAFAPESPYYLARKGKLDQAKKSLIKLLSDNSKLPSKEIIAQSMLVKIQMTIKEEEAVENGSSIIECFKGTNWRRTRIAALTWLIQNITGSSLMGYSTYFYQNAGVAESMSFNFSIIQYCLGILGTLGSWFLSQKFGRFQIYFYGLIAVAVLLMITGGLGCSSSQSASMGAGSMLMVYTFAYNLTIGPMCYCIVGEMPSAQLRSKTIMLARNLFNIAGIVVAIITPYMLNPTEWNWKAKAAFLWSGLAVCSAVWVYFELPETKGRTFAEIDKLFAERVPARQFKHTIPTTFDTGEIMEKLGNEGIKSAANDIQHVENDMIVSKV
ncbi:MAL61 Maltose permease MAL61 [Candida maltosa Xu316]